MNNTQYDLNQGQKAAADAFFEFLFDPEGKGFIISGPAGVGKTFWMGYIIDVIMPRYLEMCKLMGIDADYDSVTMTATTNKAAEVLEGATNRPTQTIHSFLNLTLFEDYTNGVMRLEKNPRTWTVHQNLIIFIDECSMIDGKLFQLLQEGTFKCKLVYVGDHNQLNPVTEKISPVYTQGYPFYELTEQMRTKVPEIQALNAQLRQTVETGVFLPIKEVPGIIDYLDDNGMQTMLANVFTQQTKESRILAYTNKRVIEYNDYVRQMRQLPDSFQANEILINNTMVKLGKRQSLSVESEVEIIANRGASQIQIETGVMLDVEYLDFSSHLGDVFHHIPVPTNRKHYNDLLAHYKAIGKRTKNWERYFYLKQNFPDLRPRDAATVHKAQGSTYETVFVDLGNISTCHQQDQAARMLYVAFSRARTRVFVYGDLAEKYGGFIRA